MTWVRKRDEKTEHGYVEERLSAYLDGELTQQERGIVERHLAACHDCRWNLDTLRQTVQWVQELPSIPVPRVFTIPVPAQPARAPRRRWGVPLLQGATALVALMLVFVVAGDFILTGSWSPLPLDAPGRSQAAPTVAAEADTGLQAVVETLEVEVTVQVELEVEAETVVEEAAVEEAPPAAMVLESPAPEAAAAESPPPERAEPPVPAAVPSLIAERILEAKATLEAPPGEGATIVEAQTAVAKAEEEQTATLAPEPSGTLTPEPTVLPTETSGPLPTPTAIPTLVPTPSPEPPMAAEAPTAVAIAPTEEPTAGGWVEPTPAAPRQRVDPLGVWFDVTEISLAAVFALLAIVTIVVMIRQRRTR